MEVRVGRKDGMALLGFRTNQNTVLFEVTTVARAELARETVSPGRDSVCVRIPLLGIRGEYWCSL